MHKASSIMLFTQAHYGGAEGRIAPPGKLNVNTGLHFPYISVLVFFWFSEGCCYFAFFGVFSGDLGF